MDPELTLMGSISDKVLSAWLSHGVLTEFVTPLAPSERTMAAYTEDLPALGKAFLAWLETGVFQVPHLKSLDYGDYNLTRLMEKGRSAITATDVKCVEQYYFLWYKYQLPYSPDKTERVMVQWYENEDFLDGVLFPDGDIIGIARYLVRKVLRDSPDMEAFRGSHGPGVVSTGEKDELKWYFKRAYDSTEEVFPFWKYLKHFHAGKGTETDEVWLEYVYKVERAERPVPSKIIFVPKDSRGPRLISAEPVELQFLQQGLKDQMVARLEKNKPSAGHVNFTDQSVNQGLALEGSTAHGRRIATLDLKDASDLIGVPLVKALFPQAWVRALLATRSLDTLTPVGDRVTLRKFAPMGSATCFPVLATSVWAIACAALVSLRGMTLKQATAAVYVYGDDLILVDCDVDCVVKCLEAFGLRVNTAKSYIHGMYRESCGMNAYMGVETTPVRIKSRWTADRVDSASACYHNWVEAGNLLFQHGFSEAAKAVFDAVEASFRVKIPYGVSTSGFPCIVVPDISIAILLNLIKGVNLRWDQNYQRICVRALGVTPRRRRSRLDGYDRLFAWFVKPSETDPGEVQSRGSVRFEKRYRAI